MGQKASTPHRPQEEADSFLDSLSLVPALPQWSRKLPPHSASAEERLLEQEFDALADEVQSLMTTNGPKTQLRRRPSLSTNPATSSRGLLRLVKRQSRTDAPSTATTRRVPTTPPPSASASSSSSSVPAPVSSFSWSVSTPRTRDEAEFLYDMGKRMLLGREGGMELQRNPRRAVNLLQRAAELGHVGAKWDLHCCRGHGDNVTLDYARAVVLYARFAKMGHPVALSNLGVCYHKGRGVRQSLRKAVHFYTQAAQLNYARGNYNLAVCYDLGEGVAQDPSKAVHHYRRSAQQGYAVAQYYMGVCYSHGKGMEGRDFKKAVSMWREAARQGHGLAQLVLANYYRDGHDLLPKDVLQAALLFRSAIEWGDDKAWERLGDIFRAPEGDFEEVLLCAKNESDLQQPRARRTTSAPSLYDQCCLHFFNRWTHHKAVATVKTEQAQLPPEVVERINSEIRKCHSPACTKLYYGAGAVQRRWRLKADRKMEQKNEGDAEGEEENVRLEGEGAHGDELTLHFCSRACASAL
jgi:TPR repeat protein